MPAEIATYCAWAAWALSWLAAALWASRAAARPGFANELLYRIVTAVGAYLLFAFASPHANPGWRAQSLHRLGAFAAPLWTIPAPAGWALFAVTLAGFAFCWWARLHLGRLWSGTVTRKAEHRIVDTGPYRIVRHPIYTGILLSAAAAVGFKATPAAMAGLALLVLGFWIKARLEERFLSAELGEEAYAQYRRRTPMLVPFLPF